MPESIKARRARRKRAAVLGVGLFALFQLLCAVGLAALALQRGMPKEALAYAQTAVKLTQRCARR